MTNIVAEHPEYEQALYTRKREPHLKIRQAGNVLTTPAGFAHQFYAASEQDARGSGRGSGRSTARGRGRGANTGRFGQRGGARASAAEADTGNLPAAQDTDNEDLVFENA